MGLLLKFTNIFRFELHKACTRVTTWNAFRLYGPGPHTSHTWTASTAGGVA